MSPSEHPEIVELPRLASGATTKLYIDGRWKDTSLERAFDSVNPSTGSVLAQVAEGGPRDVEFAVAAARRAFEGEWSRLKPADRQVLLLRAADRVEAEFEELARLDTLDMGMPISRARQNLRISTGQLRYNAGLAMSIHGDTIENSTPGSFVTYTLKEPVGVVGAIMAWNGPVGSFLRKVAPALAAGCTAVVKPSDQASLTALRLAELFAEVGFPPGVLNVVTGGKDAGAALAASPDVDLVTFTGSHPVGQDVVRASAVNLKRTIIEVGGKSPNIVFADADLDKAVAGASAAAFSNSGQICSAGTRLLVQRGISREFAERVAARANELRIGNGMDDTVEFGPVASRSQLDRVVRYIELGKREGAELLQQQELDLPMECKQGYFIPPAVFCGVENNMEIAQDEIFGPVLSVIEFNDADEAISLANSTMFGLGAGVWTSNLTTAHRVSRAIRSGSVWINCYNATDPAVPFGGYKASGYGRERGREHFEAHLETKAVWVGLD